MSNAIPAPNFTKIMREINIIDSLTFHHFLKRFTGKCIGLNLLLKELM